MRKFGEKEEMLSNKEQKVYDYLLTYYKQPYTDQNPMSLKTIVDVFGNSANGVLGKLKHHGLIEITKNYKHASRGSRAPKIIKLVEKDE